MQWAKLTVCIISLALPSAAMAGSNSFDAIDYVSHGNDLLEMGNVEAAIPAYTQAIKLLPNAPGPYLARGRAKVQKGDYDGAVADYDEAIQRDPRYAGGYEVRGNLESQRGNYASAIADLNNAIQLDSKSCEAYTSRGVARYGSGDLEGAVSDYDQAIRINGNEAYPQFYIWIVHVRQGRTEEGNRELSAYLSTHLVRSAEHWGSKVGSFLLGKITEADFLAPHSSRALRDQGEHCEAWFFAGMKRLSAGDKKAAADYLRRSLATQARNYYEYTLAEIELKALGNR
jgi:tetratricopeptide (TPR) repeat protein